MENQGQRCDAPQFSLQISHKFTLRCSGFRAVPIKISAERTGIRAGQADRLTNGNCAITVKAGLFRDLQEKTK